jgi:hypothetical protein
MLACARVLSPDPSRTDPRPLYPKSAERDRAFMECHGEGPLAGEDPR